MTPQELKNSILQLAIQGKLVEQRAEEGTAAELLEKILATKNAKSAKKNLTRSRGARGEKKTSALSASPCEKIPDDEKPFDIPECWEWVRLGDVFQHNTGKALNSSDKTGTPLSYITTSNVYWNRFELGKLKTMLFSESEVEKCTIQKGDLLVLEGGDVGRAAIWNYDFPMRIQNHIHRLRPLIDICVQYVYYIFMLYKNANMISGKGISIKGLSANALHNLLIPLPPLAEQKRIVAKIEELLPLIDRYEKAWSKLEDFNRRFPVDMQKSVLQMAIQGKLVDQRPEEGTGEDLYRKIQAEKQLLVKSGKIKKEKTLPEITEDEIPFEIPDSWKWVRLQNIVSVLGDGIHGTPVFDETGEYYFVNGNNLVNGSIVVKADTKKVPAGEYDKYKKPLDENSILISINGTIGNYAFYAGEPIILGKSACYFSVLIGVDKKYIRHLLNTKFFTDYAVKEATQTTIKNVSLKAMRMFPIPLPPLAEQKRIVTKLEELLPLCERLK